MIALRKIIREFILKGKTLLSPKEDVFEVNPNLLSDLKKDITKRSDTSNYSPSWKMMIEEFKKNILTNDINNFLQWDIVKLTITSANSTLVDTEFSELKNDASFENKWKLLLQENNLGNPEKYWGNIKYGVNKIHQTYHLMRYEKISPGELNKLSLAVEFGGGYGNMAQLFHRINPSQKYFIFDFPEMLALQKFYLNSIEIPTAFENNNNNNYATLFSDPVLLESAVKEVDGKKLFIATWSFSESPTALRKLFSSMLSNFDCFIIAFQKEFDDVTNLEYFTEWIKQFDGVAWELKEIPHFKNSYYLFGNRK